MHACMYGGLLFNGSVIVLSAPVARHRCSAIQLPSSSLSYINKSLNLQDAFPFETSRLRIPTIRENLLYKADLTVNVCECVWKIFRPVQFKYYDKHIGTREFVFFVANEEEIKDIENGKTPQTLNQYRIDPALYGSTVYVDARNMTVSLSRELYDRLPVCRCSWQVMKRR